MSMQSYLKKASQKLVVDPDAEPESPDSEAKQNSAPSKKQIYGKSLAGDSKGSQQVAKKGTRKKI